VEGEHLLTQCEYGAGIEVAPFAQEQAGLHVVVKGDQARREGRKARWRTLSFEMHEDVHGTEGRALEDARPELQRAPLHVLVRLPNGQDLLQERQADRAAAY